MSTIEEAVAEHMRLVDDYIEGVLVAGIARCGSSRCSVEASARRLAQSEHDSGDDGREEIAAGDYRYYTPKAETATALAAVPEHALDAPASPSGSTLQPPAAASAAIPSAGEYVLATKWSDGDPGDPWAVGFYVGMQYGDRHMVNDNDGKSIRAGGYRRVGRITHEFGAWLLKHADALEASPPGTVNLWTMLTDAARGMEARSGETEGLDPKGDRPVPSGTRPSEVPSSPQPQQEQKK